MIQLNAKPKIGYLGKMPRYGEECMRIYEIIEIPFEKREKNEGPD